MAGGAALAAKVAATLLTNEKTRKGVGWIIAAILSPLILVIVAILALFSGGAEHNNMAVDTVFYGGEVSLASPLEYRQFVSDTQNAFAVIESEVASINRMVENGHGLDIEGSPQSLLCGGEEGQHNGMDICRLGKCNGVAFDPTKIKSVFYFLATQHDAKMFDPVTFTDCFVRYEERNDAETVAIPLTLDEAYANIASTFGVAIDIRTRTGITEIYLRIAGSGDNFLGDALRGTGSATEVDISGFTDPTTKNNSDLVAYAEQAWENQWGYVWGTFGRILTPSLFESKLNQYPDGVGNYRDFIALNWLNRPTADCIGLIKGYGWLDPSSLEIGYAVNGMPDISADQMYSVATVKGNVSTIPEVPGLAVWHEGHIGIYIENGEVIEAMGTHYGVVKTKLDERNFTAWLKIPYINYE